MHALVAPDVDTALTKALLYYCENPRGLMSSEEEVCNAVSAPSQHCCSVSQRRQAYTPLEVFCMEAD